MAICIPVAYGDESENRNDTARIVSRKGPGDKAHPVTGEAGFDDRAVETVLAKGVRTYNARWVLADRLERLAGPPGL